MDQLLFQSIRLFLTLIKSAADLSNRRIDFFSHFPRTNGTCTRWFFVYDAVLNKLFTSPLVLLECPAFRSLEQGAQFFWILRNDYFLDLRFMQKSFCWPCLERMPESPYGNISRIIQNLSLKFKLRHWADPKCQMLSWWALPDRNKGRFWISTTLEKIVSGTLKSLFRKNPGAAHYPGSRRAVYYSLYPKLICSFFSGKRSKTSAIQRSKNYRLRSLFWKDKNTFPSLIVFQRAGRVSQAEKYLTLRYNKNTITWRSSQKKYKSFLPENSSPFLDPWERALCSCSICWNLSARKL